jgi:hypothetical protein
MASVAGSVRYAARPSTCGPHAAQCFKAAAQNSTLILLRPRWTAALKLTRHMGRPVTLAFAAGLWASWMFMAFAPLLILMSKEQRRYKYLGMTRLGHSGNAYGPFCSCGFFFRSVHFVNGSAGSLASNLASCALIFSAATVFSSVCRRS